MKTQAARLNISCYLFLLVSCLLIAVPGQAQDKMLMAWGTDYNDVNAQVGNWPGFIRSGLYNHDVEVENSCLKARYGFVDGALATVDIDRQYGSWEQAQDGLQVYLIWLERKGALVFPQSLARNAQRYVAVGEEGGFELELRKRGLGAELVIHASGKAPEDHAPSMELLTSHANLDE